MASTTIIVIYKKKRNNFWVVDGRKDATMSPMQDGVMIWGDIGHEDKKWK